MFSKIKAFFTTIKHYVENRIPILTGHSNSYDSSRPLGVSTVFTCIDILGKTLAKLPLDMLVNLDGQGKVKDKTNPLYNLLHSSPNNYTTSFNFIQTLEVNRNLKGNAFALIDRDKNAFPNRLRVVKPSAVIAYNVVDNELYYFIELENGALQAIPASDMLHFKMLTLDGIWGITPIEALYYNLSSTHKALKTIDSYYQNNAASGKAIKSTVSGANQNKMLEAVAKFKKEYAGPGNAGTIIPLPPNTEIQELSMNYKDAQFIETIKFNANQISASFGVPAHMVGNTETSKYNNVEQMSIGFKADTISPIARMYRQELEAKLLSTNERQTKSIEFNLKAMIETDHKTRMEGYEKLWRMGAINANTVARIENLPTHLEGEKYYVPMNHIATDKKPEDK